MNFLGGKHITVIGSSSSLNDMVELISVNLGVGQGGIRVAGIETNQLTSENVGDVVISPDSLKGGSVAGAVNIAEHIRSAVNSQIPIVVMVLAQKEPIQNIDGLEQTFSVNGFGNLSEALRTVLNLPQ